MTDQSKQHFSKDQRQKKNVITLKYFTGSSNCREHTFLKIASIQHFFSRMWKSTITNQQEITLEK